MRLGCVFYGAERTAELSERGKRFQYYLVFDLQKWRTLLEIRV